MALMNVAVTQSGYRSCERGHQLLRLFGEHVRRFPHAGGGLHSHAVSTWNDVYVQVEHHLTAGTLVELLNRDAVGAKDLHARLGDLLRDLDDVSQIVGGNVEDVARRRL